LRLINQTKVGLSHQASNCPRLRGLLVVSLATEYEPLQHQQSAVFVWEGRYRGVCTVSLSQ